MRDGATAEGECTAVPPNATQGGEGMQGGAGYTPHACSRQRAQVEPAISSRELAPVRGSVCTKVVQLQKKRPRLSTAVGREKPNFSTGNYFLGKSRLLLGM